MDRSGTRGVRGAGAPLPALFIAMATGAAAHASLIPVVDRVAHVFDPRSNILYITTSGGTIERYDFLTGELLAPFSGLGGAFGGIDVTPDGSNLLVADRLNGITAGVFRIFDAASGAIVQNAFYPQSGIEGGAWDATILAGDVALTSTSLNGSGSTPIRTLDLASLEFQTILFRPEESTFARSADRRHALIRGGNGPESLTIYHAETGESLAVPYSTAAALGASLSRDGSLVAAYSPVLQSFALMNDRFEILAPLGVSAGWPAAFSPIGDVVFVTDAVANQLVAFSTESYEELDRYDIGENIPTFGDDFGSMSFSGDGHTIFLTTPSGIRSISNIVPAPGVLAVLAAGLVPGFGRRRRRRTGADLALPLACAAAIAGPSLAESTLIPVPTRSDHVYDDVRGVLYIATTDGRVLRHDPVDGTLDTMYALPSTGLVAIDITPQASRLYATDDTRRTGVARIWSFAIDYTEVHAVDFATPPNQVNAHDLRITNAMHAMVSIDIALSSERVYRMQLPTEVVAAIPGSLNDRNQLYRSGDASTILRFEPGSTAGEFAVYDAPSESIVAEAAGYEHLSTAVGALDRTGDTLAISLGTTVSVLDRDLQPVEILGGFGGGVAFHPTTNQLILVDAAHDVIRFFDLETRTFVREIPGDENLDIAYPFELGEISTSADGRWLFLSTPSGIRRYDLAPPKRAPRPGERRWRTSPAGH